MLAKANKGYAVHGNHLRLASSLHAGVIHLATKGDELGRHIIAEARLFEARQRSQGGPRERLRAGLCDPWGKLHRARPIIHSGWRA